MVVDKGLNNTIEWISEFFQENKKNLSFLHESTMVYRFLIMWNIFEGHFSPNFSFPTGFAGLAEEIARIEPFKESFLGKIAKEFHERYQLERNRDSLFPREKNKRFFSLAKTPFDQLTSVNRGFFLLWVLYRFRNNLFHGNKGVLSWMNSKQQIEACIRAIRLVLNQSKLGFPAKSCQ